MPDDTQEGIDQTASEMRSASDTFRAGAEQARRTFQDEVIEPGQRAGEALKESGEKIAETNSTIGVRMIDQAEHNTREAFIAMREAASAKDLSDVVRIQGEYLRDQTNRSMAQAREIGNLIMQFGREAVGSLRGGSQP